MADTMRWRYGDTNPVVLPVLSGTVLEIGDLVYLDSGTALPAAALADAGSKAANQQAFHAKFAGVAMQRSRVGDVNPIRVATTGVFEFDCAAATFMVGDKLGPEQPTGTTALANQQVAAVSAMNETIGRCAKLVNPAGSQVLVDIVSTLMYGGPQAAL
ncbi:MAG: hypothetical protein JSS27_02515 [Planctomycetes bacterium]|nr:hypothetical protein [Planctomycetota bacterium]